MARFGLEKNPSDILEELAKTQDFAEATWFVASGIGAKIRSFVGQH